MGVEYKVMPARFGRCAEHGRSFVKGELIYYIPAEKDWKQRAFSAESQKASWLTANGTRIVPEVKVAKIVQTAPVMASCLHGDDHPAPLKARPVVTHLPNGITVVMYRRK